MDAPAYAHDCVARMRAAKSVADLLSQTTIEDCLRTGYAQALSTAIAAAVAGGLIARAVAKGLAQGKEPPKQDEPGEQKPKTKKWVLTTVGAWGFMPLVGYTSIGFKLTDLSTGRSRRIRFSGWGVGGNIGGNGSWPNPTEFETSANVTIDDFAGTGTAATANLNVLAIGYCWGYARIHRVQTKPKWIGISGWQSFGISASACVTSGKWDFPGTFVEEAKDAFGR